jgi:hypothetical protein
MKVGMYGGEGAGSGVGDELEVGVGTKGSSGFAFQLLPLQRGETTKVRKLTTRSRAILLFSFRID